VGRRFAPASWCRSKKFSAALLNIIIVRIWVLTMLITPQQWQGKRVEEKKKATKTTNWSDFNSNISVS